MSGVALCGCVRLDDAAPARVLRRLPQKTLAAGAQWEFPLVVYARNRVAGSESSRRLASTIVGAAIVSSSPAGRAAVAADPPTANRSVNGLQRRAFTCVSNSSFYARDAVDSAVACRFCETHSRFRCGGVVEYVR